LHLQALPSATSNCSLISPSETYEIKHIAIYVLIVFIRPKFYHSLLEGLNLSTGL